MASTRNGDIERIHDLLYQALETELGGDKRLHGCFDLCHKRRFGEGVEELSGRNKNASASSTHGV